MTSTGWAFKPSDLNRKHISSVIARYVQDSLTLKIQRGRGDVTLLPKFVEEFYRDSLPWLRYSLEVKGHYPSKVPKSVIAIIFPKKSRSRTLLLETTHAVRNVLESAAPKIYGSSIEDDERNYTAVIVEDVESTGISLDKIWPNITSKQKEAILDKIADILCAAIHVRPPATSTSEPDASESPPSSSSTVASSSSSTLAPPSSSSNASSTPVKAVRHTHSNNEHLRRGYFLLYSGLFHEDGEPNITAFRKRFPGLGTYELSPQETVRVKRLNTLLQANLNDFAGGNFLPPHISGGHKLVYKDGEEEKFKERKNIVHTILSTSLPRLSHKDMVMSAFYVSFEEDGSTVKSVVLTQWDKAYFVPLWASCQLPSWIEPLDPELQSLAMPADEMAKWREYLVYNLMMKKEKLPKSWLWFVAYTYGELERHFEIILTATWPSNARTEPKLRKLLSEAEKRRTTAYAKGSDASVYEPFSGKIKTMEVNFSEMLGKWITYARTFMISEKLR